jgi:hypothetical protein
MCVLAVGGAVISSRNNQLAASVSELASPTPRKRAAARSRYSEFPHNVKAHRMECASCHKFPSPNWNKVRTGDDAFPDITEYPQHQSCVGCHKAQFFRGDPPRVCSICHTNPGPRNSKRHPFPNPREIFDESAKGKRSVSDFVVQFPHDKHIEIVSTSGRAADIYTKASFTKANHRAGEESCSVCHKTLDPQGDSDDEYLTKPPENLGDGYWLKKGTFKSAPIGHATCFTCHNAETGMLPAPNDCATCHKIKGSSLPADFDPKLAARIGILKKATLSIWRERHSAGTFRHEFASHAELECAACHNVTAMNTADPKTTKVSISACAVCHVTATTDDGGAVNFEVDSRAKDPRFQCVKCHVRFGKLPIPASHVEAIKAAGGI